MAEFVKAATAANDPKRKKKERMIVITLRRLSRNKMAMAGLVIIAIMALACLCADFLAPYSYTKTDLSNLYSPPSKEHLLGTDELAVTI